MTMGTSSSIKYLKEYWCKDENKMLGNQTKSDGKQQV